MLEHWQVRGRKQNTEIVASKANKQSNEVRIGGWTEGKNWVKISINCKWGGTARRQRTRIKQCRVKQEIIKNSKQKNSLNECSFILSIIYTSMI